jgi:hypothetical protein
MVSRSGIGFCPLAISESRKAHVGLELSMLLLAHAQAPGHLTDRDAAPPTVPLQHVREHRQGTTLSPGGDPAQRWEHVPRIDSAGCSSIPLGATPV